MNRIVSRVIAGTACVAMASALGITSASAADATITVAASVKPIVNASGVTVLDGILKATASAAGTVSFTAGGKVIKGCEAVATTTVAPFTALCSGWQPAASGPIDVQAALTVTGAAVVNSPVVSVKVSKPINETTVDDISLYIDTVNGSSTPVQLTNKGDINPYIASGGCLLMSQFMQGQQIVFRLYANDHSRGGAPLTGRDASINIKIAGWETPVALNYGDHSGTAFWAGFINTGTAGSGKFSALGTINYSINITLLEKPAVTKDVMATKFVKVRNAKTKKPIKVDGAYVWKQVKVKATEIVTPAVVGRTLVMQPAAWAAAASVLTLSAKA